MKRSLLSLVLLWSASAWAVEDPYDSYEHQYRCPENGLAYATQPYTSDSNDFIRCQCTSYVAEMLSDRMTARYYENYAPNGLVRNFGNNSYYMAQNRRWTNGEAVTRWSHAVYWRDSALYAGIGVTGARDNFTWDEGRYNAVFPGDVAWWDAWDYIDADGKRRRNDYGHVAIVESAERDAPGRGVACVTLTEYNWNPSYEFNRRRVCKTDGGNSFPDAFLHIDKDHAICTANPTRDNCQALWGGQMVASSGTKIDGFGGSDPGGGPITPPPSTEPRNDLVPHVNAYLTTGDGHQVTADCGTCSTEPVTESQALRVEQIMDSKYSDASKWFRETFHSIYTTAWYQIVTADKKTVVVPWTEIFTRKFDPGRLEKDESYGESTNFTVPLGYPNHYLVIASCADPTDRVLEKDESTTRKSPATNPEQCGTNNMTRKEWLWINPKPRSVDYTIQGGGIINALDYFWIAKPYRLWYEGMNLGPDASTDRITVSIKLINPNGTRTTLLTRSIEPANLTPNAVYLDQPTDILTTPTVPGAYWFEFCINTEGKSETNTGNNCFLYRKEVRDPNVPDTIGMYQCPSIRSDTWAAWSNQSYAPPFTADGKLFFTPWCLDSNSAYLQIFVTGSGTKWVHETIYVRNGVNGTEISLPAMCSEAKSGSWCPGVARLFIQSTSIDTSVPEKPTLILAYVCDWDGTAWKCAYTQQAATKAARQ